MNKKGLDEMQIQKRNKIGNEAFIMIMYFLLIDAGLYGFGFRWIAYPANAITILAVCSGIYAARLIAGNAYAGPSENEKKPVLKTVFTCLASVFMAMLALTLIKTVRINDSQGINDLAAPIMLISGAIGIVVSVGISIIKRIQNKDHTE
ncbi:MAG: hypothetical protein BWY15_00293 [Firmicutes bacterium ADurb.Bin193]|nr:MAG: hypothetical protein BWY15_00293 [Firmicutes bacterium ADurb.Bin193]